MKGIILAGGSGTRLHPLTLSVTKQLLPVYDKPMIYYPLATLMSMEINDILIISTPQDKPLFQNLLGDGSQWGISLSYEIQEKPNGLAEAFIIGEKFIGDDSVCLILGDNIFYGIDTDKVKERIKKLSKEIVVGALVFGYQVNDPERYGVLSFDKKGNVTGIQEKPKKPKSNYAVPGLYFFDNSVVKVVHNVKPSERGELEITDVIQHYLDWELLSVYKLPRGVAWLDTGTFESLNQAGQYVETIQERQGLMVGCIEEIAYNNEWIDVVQLEKLAEKYPKNSYGKYLKKLSTIIE
jgi:glucose-1-phosphate thymidylyltransferase